MKKWINQFRHDERGAGEMVAIIIGVVIVALLAVWYFTSAAPKVDTIKNNTTTKLNSVGTSTQ